jgi:hypothetical protein
MDVTNPRMSFAPVSRRIPPATVATVGRIRRQRSCIAVLTFVISGLLTTACSSSGSPSTSPTASSDRGRGLCNSVTPAEVEAITGFPVGTPGTVVQGTTTSCTYAAANPTHRVAIRYQTPATVDIFTEKRDALVNLGSSVSTVPDLGDEAFVYSHTSGATTITTMVARQGTVMVVVTGTATTQVQLEALAQKALSAAG